MLRCWCAVVSRVVHASVHTGGRDNWRTPEHILELAREVFGGEIGCDPCTTADNPTKARVYWTEKDDGLSKGWADLTWINPPYSQAARWLECVQVTGQEAIALIPARTDTKLWHRTVWPTAQAICFWRGRIKFVGAEAGAPFPSALVYWGLRPWVFEGVMSAHGRVVRL